MTNRSIIASGYICRNIDLINQGSCIIIVIANDFCLALENRYKRKAHSFFLTTVVKNCFQKHISSLKMKLYVLICLVIATIAVFACSVSAKKGHKIIVTSAGGKKHHCNCHVHKVPVPVPVPFPVHHHIP